MGTPVQKFVCTDASQALTISRTKPKVSKTKGWVWLHAIHSRLQNPPGFQKTDKERTSNLRANFDRQSACCLLLLSQTRGEQIRFLHQWHNDMSLRTLAVPNVGSPDYHQNVSTTTKERIDSSEPSLVNSLLIGLSKGQPAAPKNGKPASPKIPKYSTLRVLPNLANEVKETEFSWWLNAFHHGSYRHWFSDGLMRGKVNFQTNLLQLRRALSIYSLLWWPKANRRAKYDRRPFQQYNIYAWRASKLRKNLLICQSNNKWNG